MKSAGTDVLVNTFFSFLGVGHHLLDRMITFYSSLTIGNIKRAESLGHSLGRVWEKMFS